MKIDSFRREMAVLAQYFLVGGLFALVARLLPSSSESNRVWPLVFKALLVYGSAVLFAFGMLFHLRVGTKILGKSPRTGQLPFWSYVVFWPFHVTNYGVMWTVKHYVRKNTPPGAEIYPGWWIGGVFTDEIKASPHIWEAIVDLTTEYSERSRAYHYLNIPTWDGNAPKREDIDRAARFLSKHAKNGPVLCHCAFGVGRSSMIMSAALVEAGMFTTYEEAFELIKAKRKIVKLNKQMVKALQSWQHHRIKAS